MYAHQSDGLAEQTIAALCETLALGNVTQVRVKATQWLTWSGHFDHGLAWNISDLQALIDARDQFAAGGIELWPSALPIGLDANGNRAADATGVEAEAQRFAAIANAIGKVDLYVEPYSDFWPAVAVGDYDAVTPLFSRIRELAPTAEITMDLPYRTTPSVEDR